jgi:hypothetical protein
MALMGLSFALTSNEVVRLTSFVDAATVAMVIVPAAIFAIAVQGGWLGFGQTLFLTGIPLGLLAVLIGDQVSLAKSSTIEDPSIMPGVVGIVLLGAMYGVLVSIIGYLILSLITARPASEDKIDRRRPTISRRFLPSAFYGALILWGFSMGISLGEIFQASALGLMAFFFFLFLATTNFKKRANVSMSAFAMAGVTSLIGLTVWYSAEIGDAWLASMVMSGPIVGLFIHLALVVDHLVVGDDDEFKPSLMNWHWLELASFLTFMLFSPATLLERIAAQADENPPTVEDSRSID